MSVDEIASLFRVIKGARDTALFRIAYHRGLRASEVGRLELKDFRPESARLYVPRLKGSNSGEYRLTAVEMAALRVWIRERGQAPGPLFLSRNHRAISRRRLDELIKGYAIAAGIDPAKAHMHSLKHSCGVHVLEREGDITLVQDHLGHRDIRSTMVYVAITNKRRDQVADRLRDWK